MKPPSELPIRQCALEGSLLAHLMGTGAMDLSSHGRFQDAQLWHQDALRLAPANTEAKMA